MPAHILSLAEARLIHLAAQGVLTPPSAPASRLDVLEAIRHMQLLQIDTINVVARSPYLVLFSRLGSYDPAWLDELLAEGKIFEQWAHAACFLPFEDYPLIRRLILEGLRSSYFSGWIEEQQEHIANVRAALKANGTVKSADFKSKKGPGGWWNWKVEKGVLEYLFSRGEVMVIRRENFQRVYDLTKRVLPDWDDSIVPSLDLVYRTLICKSVKALGITRPEWVADYYRLPKRTVLALLPEMVRNQELSETHVEGWAEPVLYVKENQPLLEDARRGKLQATHTTLLSPFDPVVWDRARVRQLFGFDFMIQAYTPAAKRQYGYFPLPLLHDGRLIGRVDAKAHRKDRIFEVKGFFLEDSVALTDEMARAISDALLRCADWHQAPQVVLHETIPAELRNSLGLYL